MNWDISDGQRYVVNATWLDVVSRGKRSDKMKKHAKGKAGEKYHNPENLGETGAIDINDACFLCAVAKKFMPQTILEIGTWFGTSAAVLAKACGGVVHTCDKNNLFVADNYNIHYYNMLSSKFLKKMLRKKMKFDMVFMDARFYPGDVEMMLKLMRRPIYFTHDYSEGEKGWRNINTLKKVFPKPYKFIQHGIIAGLIGGYDGQA